MLWLPVLHSRGWAMIKDLQTLAEPFALQLHFTWDSLQLHTCSLSALPSSIPASHQAVTTEV